MVNHILNNPLYLGKMPYKGELYEGQHKAIISQDLWDRVILENGIVGYVFQEYVEEVPEIQVEEIRLSVDNRVINKNEISQNVTHRKTFKNIFYK